MIPNIVHFDEALFHIFASNGRQPSFHSHRSQSLRIGGRIPFTSDNVIGRDNEKESERESDNVFGLQEKFKREFRLKLRHFRRGRFGKSNANHGRSASVRSTTVSEWKRGYSTRTHRTNVNGATATDNSPRRDELDMYVYKSGKITLVKCGSHSDLEELCL
jgi:hypothetical protein